jgi:hypothetical protein
MASSCTLLKMILTSSGVTGKSLGDEGSPGVAGTVVVGVEFDCPDLSDANESVRKNEVEVEEDGGGGGRGGGGGGNIGSVGAAGVPGCGTV